MAAPVLCRIYRGLNLNSSTKHVLKTSLVGGFVLQTAAYNPRPLKINFRKPYIPDKDSEQTPHWQKTKRYDRKVFAKYGSSSGIDPATLWPSAGELEQMIAEEHEWNPSLEVMLTNLAEKEREETKARLAKEKLIAANMAKMPQMIEDWRRGKREAKVKLKEEKARRAKLMDEARIRFGTNLDPRSSKFLEMVEEIEKEEKKKKKLLKRRLKQEQTAALEATTPPPDASSS